MYHLPLLPLEKTEGFLSHWLNTSTATAGAVQEAPSQPPLTELPE